MSHTSDQLDVLDPHTDQLFMQEGRKVFKDVVPMVAALISGHLEDNDIVPASLKRMWLHQANLSMNEFIARKVLGRDATREEAPVVLDDYANTSSAGSIIAFHKHRDGFETGRYRRDLRLRRRLFRRVSDRPQSGLTSPDGKTGSEKGRGTARLATHVVSRRLDILDPSPIDIEIEDIAHGLARVARWNGQTSGMLPFNVAHHSVIVEDICRQLKPGWPPKWRLAALLHDAPEYVIGDMISPFKAALGDHYKTVEHGLERAVHLRFGLPAALPEAIEKTIKRADRACAFYEAKQIAGFTDEEARKIFTAPRNIAPFDITALSTEASQRLFLNRFHEIFKAHSEAIS